MPGDNATILYCYLVAVVGTPMLAAMLLLRGFDNRGSTNISCAVGGSLVLLWIPILLLAPSIIRSLLV